MIKDDQTLAAGEVVRATFHANTKPESGYRLRATHVNGHRAPKVILSNDPRIVPGEPVMVRITHIDQPAREGRGRVVVEYVGRSTIDLGEDLWVDPLVAIKLQALLESGMNVLLDGPQGSGKTVLSRRIAQAMGMTYVFFNCSPVFEATDFLASVQVRASASGAPETVWVSTDILRALEAAHADRSKRFLIFLDELNRCRELARNGIMPALDSTRRLFNPLTGSTVVIPDNVLWIAAINSGAQFTGTTSVDPAQLDRFAPLRIGYPPKEEEVRLLTRRYPHAARRDVERVVDLAHMIRSDPELRLDLSVRATEEACLLLSHPMLTHIAGDAVLEVVKSSFCGRFHGRWDDPSSEAGMVWKLVAKPSGRGSRKGSAKGQRNDRTPGHP